MRVLFFLFIIVPVVEMWLLIEVGSAIGALPTIGLVLLTAMIGVAMLRREGLSTLMRGHRKLDEGQLPAQEMIEGLILAVSGALLLTPGFVTDFVGFLGLIPASRKRIARRFIASGSLQAYSFTETGFRSGPTAGDEHVIEGEFQRNDEKNH